ncbi:DUF6124 family protein [Pseudomonas sp. 20TX0172]|nr:DUF6124 family protein [Pseudomonas uvaldensis]
MASTKSELRLWLKLHRPPPATDETVSRVQSARNKKFDDAATRTLDYYLNPKPKKETSDNPNTIYRIASDVDSECLLATLSENLVSANAMIGDLASDLEGSRRHVALGIQQVVELNELLANRALDIVEVR